MIHIFLHSSVYIDQIKTNNKVYIVRWSFKRKTILRILKVTNSDIKLKKKKKQKTKKKNIPLIKSILLKLFKFILHL